MAVKGRLFGKNSWHGQSCAILSAITTTANAARPKGDIQMSRFTKVLRRINDEEEGHVAVGVPALLAAVGAIILMIGAAGDTDALTIIGGIVLAVGIFGASLARHRAIDYDIYERLDKLEK